MVSIAKSFDVIVIGGGPAGMMAAGRAAELNCSVLLLEKNPALGKKLLMTGGGRCNLTNNNQDIRLMAGEYKGSAKFLMSAFSQFDVKKTIEFFNSRGMKTKEEAERRVFPVSNKSQSVLDVLVKYMEKGGVEVKTRAVVADVSFDKGSKNFTVKLKDGKIFTARSCVVATGGISHPETGSTGEGFAWLKKMGHAIVKNNFALVPIAIKDKWVKKMAGLALSGIKLTAFQEGKKQEVQKGKLLFTHFGISGPAALNMSKGIGELMAEGDVIVALDLFPNLDYGALKEKLQNILIAQSNKKLKNALSEIIPSALVPIVLEIAEINGDTANHSVRHGDRMKLIKLMKEIPMRVEGLLGADKAIVSSGGVKPEEVDFKTMQSRIVPNLRLIGDTLDINRPSGGYSLQLCWTTGFVAGTGAAIDNR